MNSARVHCGFAESIKKINDFAAECGVKVGRPRSDCKMFKLSLGLFLLRVAPDDFTRQWGLLGHKSFCMGKFLVQNTLGARGIFFSRWERTLGYFKSTVEEDIKIPAVDLESLSVLSDLEKKSSSTVSMLKINAKEN